MVMHQRTVRHCAECEDCAEDSVLVLGAWTESMLILLAVEAAAAILCGSLLACQLVSRKQLVVQAHHAF